MTIKQKSNSRLGVCGHCDSPFTHPVEAQRTPTGLIRLVVRCPECEALIGGEYTVEQIEDYDRLLTNERNELQYAYESALRSNILEELDRLSIALDKDLIGPDDFRPYRFTPAPTALAYQA